MVVEVGALLWTRDGIIRCLFLTGLSSSSPACRFCRIDNRDHRVLLDSAVVELEHPLTDYLTDLMTVVFSEDEGSCLFGKTITVDVSFQQESNPGCN